MIWRRWINSFTVFTIHRTTKDLNKSRYKATDWVFNTNRVCHVIVGQLRPWKWHYCAVSVKSVRFGRECKQSKSNIILICHVLWHFQESLGQDKQFDTIFRKIGACFNFWPMWNSQSQWRPSWKCHNMWYIRKMLFMLLLNSVQSLTVLTFCAQWMVLAALLLGATFNLVTRVRLM